MRVRFAASTSSAIRRRAARRWNARHVFRKSLLPRRQRRKTRNSSLPAQKWANVPFRRRWQMRRAAPPPAPEKGSSAPAIVFIVLFCVAAVGAVCVPREDFQIYRPGAGEPPAATATSVHPPAPPKPAVVAPPANDARWMLNLECGDNSRFAGGGAHSRGGFHHRTRQFSEWHADLARAVRMGRWTLASRSISAGHRPRR